VGDSGRNPLVVYVIYFAMTRRTDEIK